jgi:hypothetical protein
VTAFFEEAEDGVGHEEAGKLGGIAQRSKNPPVCVLKSGLIFVIASFRALCSDRGG